MSDKKYGAVFIVGHAGAGAPRHGKTKLIEILANRYDKTDEEVLLLMEDVDVIGYLIEKERTESSELAKEMLTLSEIETDKGELYIREPKNKKGKTKKNWER